MMSHKGLLTPLDFVGCTHNGKWSVLGAMSTIKWTDIVPNSSRLSAIGLDGEVGTFHNKRGELGITQTKVRFLGTLCPLNIVKEWESTN